MKPVNRWGGLITHPEENKASIIKTNQEGFPITIPCNRFTRFLASTKNQSFPTGEDLFLHWSTLIDRVIFSSREPSIPPVALRERTVAWEVCCNVATRN